MHDAVEGDYLASKKLLDVLTKGIALELQVSMKYMWQHILVKGLEDILIDEEKHLDTFSKLLVGMTSPFTQP
jgi:hypothetical protein